MVEIWPTVLSTIFVKARASIAIATGWVRSCRRNCPEITDRAFRHRRSFFSCTLRASACHSNWGGTPSWDGRAGTPATAPRSASSATAASASEARRRSGRPSREATRRTSAAASMSPRTRRTVRPSGAPSKSLSASTYPAELSEDGAEDGAEECGPPAIPRADAASPRPPTAPASPSSGAAAAGSELLVAPSWASKSLLMVSHLSSFSSVSKLLRKARTAPLVLGASARRIAKGMPTS
mmetsp:Transcript_23164/g.65373  ORF Transcript_23164/g.65373 Transcript_23164/m.65373 type:complete len:238 (+) Transcript_23164:147-860(+)